MAMLKYLLDTNIVIYVIKKRPMEVLEVFNKNRDRMAISVITAAELVHGAEKSLYPERNLEVVEDFLSRLSVLPYDLKAAYHYGSIRAAQEKMGRPMGVNDLHIAAQARSHALVLVTNNIRDFENVPGLVLENWL